MFKFNSTIAYMAYDIAIVVAVAVCVYIKLIPNDLLLVAIGSLLRGSFGVIPTTSAINANTQATQANTAATLITNSNPIASDSTPGRGETTHG